MKGIYTDLEYLNSLGVNTSAIDSLLLGPTDGTLWDLIYPTALESTFDWIVFKNVTFKDLVFADDEHDAT